jgi:acyl-CoA thioester hydrolase
MVGISHTELAQADTAFAIIHMTLDFKRSARIDDALVVRTTYDRVKGVRLYVTQKVTRGDEVLLEAKGEAVCITLDGRPRRPTAQMLAQLAPWLAAKEN